MAARDPVGAPTLPPLIVVAGATASGKTALSLALAEVLARDGVTAEIVSADSRQVYRGMDIGTAKATHEERARVRQPRVAQRTQLRQHHRRDASFAEERVGIPEKCPGDCAGPRHWRYDA